MAQWTLTPVAYDGLGGAPFDPDEAATFVRPTQVELSRERGSVSPAESLIRVDGLLETQFFFPPGAGAQWIERLIDAYHSLFRNYTEDGLEFLEAQRVVVGYSNTEGFYQVNLRHRYVWLGRTPTGFSEEVEQMIFSQSAHGFAAGDAIQMGSTGWAKALANSTATLGSAIVTEVLGDQFLANSHGFVTVNSHGFTQGARLYLSTATAGQFTTTLPTGIVQDCGEVVDANTININFRMHTT